MGKKWCLESGNNLGKNKVWTRMKNKYLKAIEDMHKLPTNVRVEFSRTTEHNIHFLNLKV